MRSKLPAALQSRDYALLWFSLLCESFGTQMVAVAIGWQVFAVHRSAFDLGLVGLFEFLPLLLLSLPAGQLADRHSRRLILAAATALNAVVAVALIFVTLGGASQLWPFLALSALNGVAMAAAAPSGRALGPSLVPWELLPSALALRSIAFQSGTIAGPAIGGLLFSIRPEVTYAVAALLCLLGVVATLAIHEPHVERTGEAVGFSALLAGLRFIRHAPVMLGAITLDLFAVLFGGAMALMPLFAREILHVGPVGLGVLRSAPAVGALVAGVALTRRPVTSRTGTTLLLVVGAFGVATVVFGLSKSFPLSVAALAVAGGVDMVSVNIRSTIAIVASPEELRGRVTAVESIFISASNELGAFESGVVAALIGAVPAVVAGGAITIVLAAVWKFVFPALARIDRIDELRPEPVAATAL